MRTPQQELILDLMVRRISEDEFLRGVGVAREDATAFALRNLEEAYRQKSEDDVDYGLGVGFHFGFTTDFLDLLIRLSDADWHHSHEDVVTALGELRDTRTVEALYRAALIIHPYLEYDDCRALAVKAIWALGNLGDSAADQKLRLLAESTNSVVRTDARKQLYRRSGLVTAEERKRGQALCDRIDKEKDPTVRAQLIQQLKERIERENAAEQEWMAAQGWGTTPPRNA
jgi:hypothetical protein